MAERGKPSRLIVGILARSSELLQQAESLLAGRFGPILLSSEVMAWNFSRYYEPEMGPGLIRRWVCHVPLLPPVSVLNFKKEAMLLEARLRDARGNRQVNLDPGILTLHNLILATTKDYAHRIYLGEGVYAEVTLIFSRGQFQPLPWTYADYRTAVCLDFLNRCRQELLSVGGGGRGLSH